MTYVLPVLSRGRRLVNLSSNSRFFHCEKKAYPQVRLCFLFFKKPLTFFSFLSIYSLSIQTIIIQTITVQLKKYHFILFIIFLCLRCSCILSSLCLKSKPSAEVREKEIPRHGGIYRRPLEFNPRTLDPALSRDIYSVTDHPADLRWLGSIRQGSQHHPGHCQIVENFSGWPHLHLSPERRGQIS